MSTRRVSILLSLVLAVLWLIPSFAWADGETVTLRISNWEEYIDLGDWGEDEVIDLESGDIFGENSMVDDFAEWYEETYGKKVNVEYSTFGWQYISAAACIMWISSSERTPAMAPLSFTPTRRRPPSVLAKAARERAMRRLSEISNLKSSI